MHGTERMLMRRLLLLAVLLPALTGCGSRSGPIPGASPPASVSPSPAPAVSTEDTIDPAHEYRTTDLGTLGGARSAARAINDLGEVVGDSETAAGDTHPFLWRQGTMIDLGILAGHTARAMAINNRGQVAGTTDVASGGQHAFIWQSGTMTDLGTLGGPVSAAYGINDSGQIVGNSINAAGQWRSFLWQNGTMTELGQFDAAGINSQEQIVGSAEEAGVLWQRGVLTELGSPTTRPTDISDNATVVGNRRIGNGPEHAFVWRLGTLTDLGTLGGEHSVAGSVNNHDQVIGMSSLVSPSPAPEHAFLWQRGVMADLTTRGLDPTATVACINDRGAIAGTVGGRAALFT